MARFIGIRHRVKKTSKGEARPTQVAIIEENGEVVRHDLETVLDEKDFILGLWPSKHRKVESDEDMTKFFQHQVKWKKVKDDEEWEATPENQRRVTRKKERMRAVQVPDEIDGLCSSDTVAMLMGGSGGLLASALSRRAQQIGAKVVHAPTYVLKPLREDDRDKDKDAETLAQLVRDEPALFYEIVDADRAVLAMSACYHSRMDAMTERRACAQRLRQRCLNALLASEEDILTDIEDLEDYVSECAKNDPILTAVETEEKRRDAELAKAINQIGAYTEVFAKIRGCGPTIAGAILSSVVNIERFATDAKFKAFCGVHVMPDGSFPRHKKGGLGNWQPDARQAFYQLTDQFVRQTDKTRTEWGRELLMYKAKFREAHPVPLVSVRELVEFFRRIERFMRLNGAKVDPAEYALNTVDGLYGYFTAGVLDLRERYGDDYCESEISAFEKDFEKYGNKEVKNERVTIYSPGHIHNMARWRVATRLAELWYKQLTAYAKSRKQAMAEAA